MAEINTTPSRSTLINSSRPAATPSTRPAGAAPAGSTDQVTLSDAAQKSQQQSQPKPEPAPEKKGFWRGVMDFFVDGVQAKQRVDMQMECVKMGLDPNKVGKDGIYREPGEKKN